MLDYLLYRVAYFLYHRLPLEQGYALATFLSILKYYVSPRDRKAVIGNLKRILPPQEHAKIRRYAKEVFVNFGKYLIEFFRLSLLKKEDLGGTVKIEGLEHIQSALNRGKGVIFLSAHIGNWELAGTFMGLLGYPIFGVALPHRHRRVNSFFNRQREKLGMLVIPSTGPAVRKVYEELRKNHLIALVGDRDFGGSGKRVEFLGASKLIPKGPAFLSIRTGAAIVPAFSIRRRDNTHVVQFSVPLPANQSEDELIITYAKIIESEIRKNPTQWLMFREFWKE